jgi:hypothetical protein
VTKLAAAAQRFPDRELEIHRLCVRDQEFLSACEDLAEADAALEHWRSAEAKAAGRAEEYRALAEELAAVVLAALDRSCFENHAPAAEPRRTTTVDTGERT